MAVLGIGVGKAVKYTETRNAESPNKSIMLLGNQRKAYRETKKELMLNPILEFRGFLEAQRGTS